MQCFMQIFGRQGKPQLNGGSTFKDHVDWLLLLGWQPGATDRVQSNAARADDQRFRDIRLTLRADNPVLGQLQQARDGLAADWSKGTIDCFTEGDNPIWSMRLTLQEPVVSNIRPLGGVSDGRPPLLAVEVNFTASSIDFRQTEKPVTVTYDISSGAIWDPEEQVCREIDPDDPVSRLPE
jgi:hypothetical protein